MTEKLLGKITSAEFGTIRDYPFMIGLQLYFKMSSSGVGDGGRYTVNISDACKWHSSDEKLNAYERVLKSVNGLLEDAKVNYVSELIGKPVEVTLEHNTFKDFRILTEVL